MRFIIRDILFSNYQSLRYAAGIRPYPVLFLLLFAGARVLWNRSHEILGHDHLVVSGFIGTFCVLVQGVSVAALAYAISRRLLLGSDVTLLGAGELLSWSFARYVALVVVLRFAGALGEIFCLFGDSSYGPGRMTDTMAWGVAGVVWLLSAFYFSRLALGVPNVSFARSVQDMRRSASLSAGARLGGSVLLAQFFAWLVPQVFWTGQAMAGMNPSVAYFLWVLFHCFGQILTVCAFTVMACVLFWPSREQELAGLSTPS